MNLSELLIITEEKYLHKLEDYFNDTWGDTKIWSHDLSHHRRVWSFAKELMLCTDIQYVTEHQSFPDKLIIACYLHDLGMSVDSGSKHGIQSRKFCEQFLIKNDLNKSNYLDVLVAIENHDYKDYAAPVEINSVLCTLNAADDLDAFGYIGIYRYSEIYLMRGADPSEIGYLIQGNAAGRFENFRKNFDAHKEIVTKHKKRYEILMDFFRKYNNQMVSYSFGKGNPSGYCGVIEILSETLNKSEGSLKKFSFDSDDVVIKLFFSELEKEWRFFQY